MAKKKPDTVIQKKTNVTLLKNTTAFRNNSGFLSFLYAK